MIDLLFITHQSDLCKIRGALFLPCLITNEITRKKYLSISIEIRFHRQIGNQIRVITNGLHKYAGSSLKQDLPHFRKTLFTFLKRLFSLEFLAYCDSSVTDKFHFYYHGHS
ncbi:hypothetical protein CDAR_536761 [Caerostris darwini]|uniref:Maturase K n=1 Tax=Caerostris darwini TaxID=1538125 RepID=A0AAV4VHY6_9ARAC|nr:hypothetical protein CDAR_536761 [Caerostris darwini]